MKDIAFGMILTFCIFIFSMILPDPPEINKKSNVAVPNNEVKNKKQYKYEVWLLGGFKDTITCEYKPNELEIFSLQGEYSLRYRKAKPLDNHPKIVVGCVRYKLINE